MAVFIPRKKTEKTAPSLDNYFSRVVKNVQRVPDKPRDGRQAKRMKLKPAVRKRIIRVRKMRKAKR